MSLQLDPAVIVAKIKVIEDILSNAPVLVGDVAADTAAYESKDPVAIANALTKTLQDITPLIADLKATVQSAPVVAPTPVVVPVTTA
jgi:hypothetical protein